METRVVSPTPSRPIVNDEGVMTEEFRRFIQSLVNGSTIVSTGSPEGVIEAPVNQRYMDDSGTAGAITYIKKLDNIGGDRKQGWILD